MAADFSKLGQGCYVRIFKVNVDHAGETNIVQGKVLGVGTDFIELQLDGVATPLLLPLSDVDSIDLRVQESHEGRWAVSGLVVGAFAGYLCGQSVGAGEGEWGPPKSLAANVLGTVFGTLGLVFGSQMAPIEEWEAVPVGTLRLHCDHNEAQGNRVFVAVGF